MRRKNVETCCSSKRLVVCSKPGYQSSYGTDSFGSEYDQSKYVINRIMFKHYYNY